MKSLWLVCVMWMVILKVRAQESNDFMINGSTDLMKTDNSGIFAKAQSSVDLNYFFTRTITATAGLEYWTDRELNYVIGARYYPSETLFIRARGLIGSDEVCLGAGWTQPITQAWHFEAMGDFYFNIEFAIRIGMGYVIGKR